MDVAPKVAVSKAVAVQIYFLIFDQRARAKELKDVRGRGLYTILASLSRGSRTEPPSSSEAEKLQLHLGRPATKGREPGLALRFRDMVNERRDHAELVGLSLEDARRHLFLRSWDSEPLDFAFDQNSGGASTAAGKASAGGGGRTWRRRRWRRRH